MLLYRDIRRSLRMFASHPVFTAVTLFTLALGIGANTAIFTLVNSLLLRDLPAPSPRELVHVSVITRSGGSAPFSYVMFRELARRQQVFSGVFGASGLVTFNVELNGALFQSNVRAVSGNYFSELGASPLIGRLLTPEDEEQRTRVAVISYEFWERRFGRDPDVLSKSLRVEGQLYAIVGVSRRWFAGLNPGEPPEVVVPLTASPFDLENRSVLWLFALGRLNPGTTLEQARAQLRSVWPDILVASVPTEAAGQRRQSFLATRVGVESAAKGISTDLQTRFTQPLYLLMGVVGLVLLIACANLANLMLARAAARQHEVSIRTALGAGRGEIVRQVLVETMMISAGGALLALAVAYWGVPLLVRLMTETTAVPVILDSRPDWSVFGFTAAVSVVTALLMALAPAWHLARIDPAAVLREDERTSSRRAGSLTRKTLLIVQVALSVVLVVGAGLLVRTIQRLSSIDAGFTQTGVIEMPLYPRPEGYKNLDMNVYRKQVIDDVVHLPGVHSAAFSNLPVPAGDNGWQQVVAPAGADISSANAGVPAILAVVSPGLFRTLELPLLSGRDFEWTDSEQHGRVAIIDRGLAERLFPSGNAVGQSLRFGIRPEFQEMGVVGVVSKARMVDVRTADSPVIYVPYLQHPSIFQFSRQGNLFVHANDAERLMPTVARTIDSLGHEYTDGGKSVSQMYRAALVEERAAALLSSFFAVLAILTAGLGVFGLMSYSVAQRTHEIGVRMALGSTSGKVLQLVLRESLVLLLVGLAIGLPGAIAATRIVARILYVSPQDPLTLIVVSLIFLLVGLVAGYLPARRATKLNPMVALRHE